MTKQELLEIREWLMQRIANDESITEESGRLPRYKRYIVEVDYALNRINKKGE